MISLAGDMMTDSPPIVAYHQSPWNYEMLFVMSIMIGFFIYGVIRSEHLQQKNGKSKYAVGILVLLFFIGAGVWLTGSWATRRSPWLAIYNDHLTCGSWIRDGRFLKTPWKAFTNVTKVDWPEARLRRPLEVHLRFYFRPDFAEGLQTTDYFRQQGWFACQIDGLVESSNRLGLPLDTDEIHRKVRQVWQLNNTINRWEDLCATSAARHEPWCAK